MPNLSVGDILQVRIEYELYGQKDLSVLHWRVKAIDPGVELFAFLRDRILPELTEIDGFCDVLLTHMSNDIKIAAVVAQVISPVRYRHVRRLYGITGHEIEPAGTNNVAVSIGYAGELAGRGKGGRTQVPGICKKYITGGMWSDVPVNQLTEHFENWRVLDWDTGFEGCVLDPILYTPATGAFNPIVACEGHRTVRTMRRRTVGVGQ